MDTRSRLGKLGTIGTVARLSVLILVASLIGCAGRPSPEVTAPGLEEVAAEAERAPAPPVTDPVVGDVVPIGRDGGNVAVLSTEADVNAGRLFPPGRGKEYFAAEVRGCSGPNEQGLRFEKRYFILEMADKTVHDPGLGIKRPELAGGEVPAGGCLEGWVTFTIPEGKAVAFVVYQGSEELKWRIRSEEPAEG